MTTAKDRAVELYNQHIALAGSDGRNFRKLVMDTLMVEMGISLASAATHYNNAKKAAPVEGLGRAAAPAGLKKPGSSTKGKKDELQDDNECFTVLEVDGLGDVARCQAFLLQGDASEKFDEKIEAWPNSTWVLIQGLGPNSGDTYRLAAGEKEIKRHGKVGLNKPEEVAA